MSTERFQRAKELFLAACELPEEERGAFLERESGGDAELRREVEELLGVDAGEVSILEAPAVGATTPTDSVRPLTDSEWERLSDASAARNYDVEGEIARGGMGAILRVEDRDLGRSLAMKIALGPADTQGSDLARFLEEAQITAQLDHPGIAPVHDLGVDSQGRLYFTMKLVRGRDLGEVLDLVQRGAEGWSRARALGLLLKVCEATAYAHDKGVVHRDLKPANVMVGAYGEVYVMDWGVARVLGATRAARPLDPVKTVRSGATESRPGVATDETPWTTRAGAVVGTPYFMAPEQARGEEVGPQVDVYAVGAMLYQLLTGRRPYEQEESVPAVTVLARVVAGPPTPVQTLAGNTPGELIAICERAMAARPDDRYPDMGALGADLRAFLEGRVVRAYETGALAELRKWVGRNRLAAAALGFALLAVVTGLWWSRQAEAASRREIDLASDYYRAKVLSSSADDLWPAVPRMVPELEDWLQRARALVDRREQHERRRSELQERTSSDANRIALERQAELVVDLDLFTDGNAVDPGLLEQVEARLEFAQTIEERSVSGDEATLLWRRVRESIRSGETHPGYAGLELEPQLGLLPLGVDPASGLWLFTHLASGDVPELDEQGNPIVTEDTGLVLLLLPGGSFPMGASSARNGANHDPVAAVFEEPVLDVTLAPFFLSKYEMTQAQWKHCTRRNPSKWAPGEGFATSWTNPVEQVSWEGAQRLLERMSLTLPTEARWEYACRAGTTTPFPFPQEDLEAFANVADQAYIDSFGSATAGVEGHDDGFAVHAPVGSFWANEFGLCDMHGNVFEWTLDAYGDYEHPRREGDGFSLGPGSQSQFGFWSPEYRVVRGGTFEVPAEYARASHRVNLSPTFINHGLGLRPARDLDP